ncbi:hypothetical protein GCM10023350_13090 [Nocardioides endophyticus]|uniref:DUF4365 domain-containing protein n=1 Tax=Nocardioides endophyticus TaxID=1353775 RepID=A0ABP8YIK2_9ACTN
MSLAHIPQGERNLLQGDFGEAWVHTAAAGCGIDHGTHATVDRIKADIRLTHSGIIGGVRNPSVLVQVKTTIDLRDHDTHWAYDLDAATHEVLRQTDHQTRRILAVIGLSEDGETLRLEQDGTLLVGQTSWVSLEGLDATDSTSTQVVYLPKDQVLDPDGFQAMLSTYGVPRSSQVPEVNEWGDGS